MLRNRLGAALLWRDRRGMVALMIGLAAPVLAMAVGIGVEVSRWSVAKMELQGIADAAAIAGALNYQQANDPQKATIAAAYVAQINGIAGMANPVWNATTKTLTDNLITAQIVAGPRNTNDVAVQVSVSRSLPLYLAGVFTSASAQTVSATAVAEIVQTSSGPPACLLALKGDVNGVTIPPDITISGHVTITASNCALRSDASVSINGNVTITAAGIIAAGTVGVSGGSADIEAPITQNAGQIPDPFANNTALQSALNQVAQTSGRAINCSGKSCTGPGVSCSNGTCTIQPGSYSAINASGQVTLVMSPGLYLVNGPVSFSGQTGLRANGVTIVSTGAGSFSGGSAQQLTAATTASASNGAIPGIVFASLSNASFSGNSSLPFSGAIYLPNGALSISGTATDGSSGCAEVVAQTITLTGNAAFSTNCSSYGLPVINSLQTTTTALVR
jgi:Flp pilus assembly protein TadG